MKRVLGAVLVLVSVLAVATAVSLHRPWALSSVMREAKRPLILDRRGQPIRASFGNQWNVNQQLSLNEWPPFLVKALVVSEDGRFFEHSGIDWRARGAAFLQNIKARRVVRGASTIDQQVVRMFSSRPRNLWSKWIEGWEAVWLNRLEDKNSILEFYLNQVPFTGQRRGFSQASWFYFDRDLSTLTENEILSLVVMVRNPSLYDPFRSPGRLQSKVSLLAQRLGVSTSEPVEFVKSSNGNFAPHFVRFVEQRRQNGAATVRSTLDPNLQRFAQDLLNRFVRTTPDYHVENGAILVVDHQSDEILAWAVGSGNSESASSYDAVRVPRQPGSTIKPFLYTVAFENGWNDSSLIEDTPLEAAVGAGLHRFKNYSRQHYGQVTLREALANSLNIPAVRLIQAVGAENLRVRLNEAGMRSLNRTGDYYGDGLALGDGEVSLFEMTQAYATLARRGVFRPLRAETEALSAEGKSVFQTAAADLTGDILSDKNARRLEFSEAGTMNFPVQTAVKTGTSTDHRDAWAFAYNYRYVVGIWLGNLDNLPTKGLTGVAGPVVLARAVMNELNRFGETQPLAAVHRGSTPPLEKVEAPPSRYLRIVRPTAGLAMAVDPRVSRDSQAFLFEADSPSAEPIQWYLNGRKVAVGQKWQWRLEKGRHLLTAVQGGQTAERRFTVK